LFKKIVTTVTTNFTSMYSVASTLTKFSKIYTHRYGPKLVLYVYFVCALHGAICETSGQRADLRYSIGLRPQF